MSSPSDAVTPNRSPSSTPPTGLSSATQLVSEQGTTVHLVGDPPTVTLAHGGHVITTPLADLDNVLEHVELELDSARADSPATDAAEHKRATLRHQRDRLVITKYAIEAARYRDQHHHLGTLLPYRRVSALRDDALAIINRADELLVQQTDEAASQHGLLARVRTVLSSHQ
jgi:hypothetical protein